MKMNFVQIGISILISLIMAYGLFSFTESENGVLLSVGGFIYFSTTLSMSFGIKFDFPRTTINIKVISFIFFIIGLISNLVFMLHSFTVPSYIILNSLLFITLILIAYSIYNLKQ